MSVVTKDVVINESALMNKGWLAFAFTLYTVFYMWVRWYEGTYGWSAGLDSFAPEFALTAANRENKKIINFI